MFKAYLYERFLQNIKNSGKCKIKVYFQTHTKMQFTMKFSTLFIRYERNFTGNLKSSRYIPF